MECHTCPSFEVERREVHLCFIDGGNDALAETRVSNTSNHAAANSQTNWRTPMRTILKSAIIISALVAGGSAFAEDNSDSSLSQMIAQSQLSFAAQSSNRVATGARDVTGSITQQTKATAAASQNFYPVDTSSLNNGSNR